MQRRDFLKSGSIGALALSVPRLGSAAAHTAARSSAKRPPWRTLDVVHRVELNATAASTLWLPLPKARTSYQELLEVSWTAPFTNASIAKDPTYGDQFLFAKFDGATEKPFEVSYRVRTRDRDWAEPELDGERDLYLRPTAHIPLDGIVAETSHKIVKNERSPDRKARLIYEWIALNTARDGKVRGCGLGDVRSMLSSGNLTGKCADLSSLFVGLCRAAGVPAREVFGCRASPSKLAKSIGKEGDVSKGQHCRAEYLSARGWNPVDPADVRKVMLEESLTYEDAKTKQLREKLFGFWEMNWVAYNSARDFALPRSDDQTVNFMMYPRLVSGADVRDGMEPDAFRYTITAKESA